MCFCLESALSGFVSFVFFCGILLFLFATALLGVVAVLSNPAPFFLDFKVLIDGLADSISFYKVR